MVDDISGATGQFFSLLRKDDKFQISNAYALRRTIQVETIKLDDIIDDGFNIPDLMKVDIEEAEELMFQGAKKIVKNAKTIIIIETYNLNIIQSFKDKEYSVFSLDESLKYAFLPKKFKSLNDAFMKKYTEI